MYRSLVKTKRIELDSEKDLAELDKILNNPLCVVISEQTEKISDREMGTEGNIVGIHDRLVKVISYKEKNLL